MEVAAKSVNTQLLKLRISEGNVEAIKDLIQKGANINHQDEHGWTFLHLALAKGEEEMVQVFLEANADPNICSNGLTSPLMTAFNRGHYKMFECLIQKGANVNHHDEENWSVLFSACLSGNEEIVDILLNANADPNVCTEEGKSPLMMASQMGNVSIIKKLLLAEAGINKEDGKGLTAFEIAMIYGMDEAVEVLPLPDAFKRLLTDLKDENFDYEVYGKVVTLTKNLQALPSSRLINLLVQKGFEVNHRLDGRTPLMFAAKKGNPHIVKNLLDIGADINLQSTLDGETALFFAVSNNKEATVDLLLKEKADPNISRNDNKKTPLMEASSDGHLSMVKKLLLYGANVNLKDTDGKTAWDWAWRTNAIERILEDAKKAGSMTGIGLEPQVAEHLSTVGAFLELKDENIDVAQLKEKMTEMRKTLKSFQALLGQDSVPDDDSD